MAKLVNTTPDPLFFIFYLHNVHNNYRWRGLKKEDELQPSERAEDPKVLVGEDPKLPTAHFTKLRNSYASGVKFADQNVKSILDFIDKTPRGKEAIVVLMSDHGEMLGEKFGLLIHGGRPYKERIMAPFAIRFGTRTKELKRLVNSNMVASTDLFPTIFSFLDLQPSPQALMDGKSLIDKTARGRNSVLTVRPNRLEPTFEMVASNSEGYKIYMRHPTFTNTIPPMNKDIFYKETTGMNVFDITDKDDNPIFVKNRLLQNAILTTRIGQLQNAES